MLHNNEEKYRRKRKKTIILPVDEQAGAATTGANKGKQTKEKTTLASLFTFKGSWHSNVQLQVSISADRQIDSVTPANG